MIQKIIEFCKDFFHNIAADPVSSMKGVVNFGVVGLVYYAMNKGAMPEMVGWSFMLKAATDGLHALGVNNFTPEEIAETAVKIGTFVKKEEPVVLSLVEQYQQLEAEANEAQKKVDAFKLLHTGLSDAIEATRSATQIVHSTRTLPPT